MNDQQQTSEGDKFETALVNKIAREAVVEQRRARRWGIFFKLFAIAYILSATFIYTADKLDIYAVKGGKHTALVDVSGVISAESPASADRIISGLRAAFEDANTAGVILRINSPGGSPVQAGYVSDEIYRLRAKYPHTSFYSVITDICTSGGYYIAAAADNIYANKASIVGSVGVVLSSFGFVNAIEKLGVERRLLHAGANKGSFDPFLPVKDEEIEHMEKLLVNVHQQFISVIKKGRGDKLIDDEKLFSGLIWTGEQSVELGLVDALGSASYVAREVIGEEEIVNFTKKETFFDQFNRSIGIVFNQKLSNLLMAFELR